MKLCAGIVTALASCALAASTEAPVLMFPKPSLTSTSTPSLPRSLARLLLLQRAAQQGLGPSTAEVADGIETQDVVRLMNEYGKAPLPLFSDDQASAPRQLVVMVEGINGDQIDSFSQAAQPAFTISDPPCDAAHGLLVKNDFYNAGVVKDSKCSMGELLDQSNEACWSGRSAIKRVNAAKDAGSVAELRESIARLERYGASGLVETTIVLLPSVSESSSTRSWSAKPQELRRRQAEQLVSAVVDSEEPTSDTSSSSAIYLQANTAPSCFSSEDSCSSTTGNCSGHGMCQNKYANPDGSEGSEVCYQCHCLSTESSSGSITHWAGPTCAKKDISAPFWLFAGFTVLMLFILAMSIGMLFSVGEEKLPGVIGAGVSRSK